MVLCTVVACFDPVSRCLVFNFCSLKRPLSVCCVLVILNYVRFTIGYLVFLICLLSDNKDVLFFVRSRLEISNNFRSAHPCCTNSFVRFTCRVMVWHSYKAILEHIGVYRRVQTVSKAVVRVFCTTTTACE